MSGLWRTSRREAVAIRAFVAVAAREVESWRQTAPMEIQIRPAGADDAPEIARIYVESWNAGFGDLMGIRRLGDKEVARWSRELAEPDATRWWVGERAGRIAGFVGIGPSRDPVDPAVGELDTIAVDPAAWRSGVGRALMTTAIEALTAAGYDRAILWTVEGYERGQRFYESQGWVRDGRRRDEGRQIAYERPLAGRPPVAQSGSSA
jgi:GNAT superfamily N-acetyltransferase